MTAIGTDEEYRALLVQAGASASRIANLSGRQLDGVGGNFFLIPRPGRSLEEQCPITFGIWQQRWNWERRKQEGK